VDKSQIRNTWSRPFSLPFSIRTATAISADMADPVPPRQPLVLPPNRRDVTAERIGVITGFLASSGGQHPPSHAEQTPDEGEGEGGRDEQGRDMADLSRLIDELSSLTVLEATELAKLLEAKWQLSKGWRSPMKAEELEKRNIEKMGEALGKQYSALCHEVTILHLYWKEYTELFSTNQKRIDRLN
jgi:hypothetical protein